MKQNRSKSCISVVSFIAASLLGWNAQAAFDGKIEIKPTQPTATDKVSIVVTKSSCRTGEETSWKENDFKINLNFSESCDEVSEQDFKTEIGPLEGDKSYRIRFGSLHPGLDTPVLRHELKFDVLPAGQQNSVKGQHETPAANADVSGVSVIRGWVCDAQKIEVSFDGRARFPVAYGTERGDTQGACGDVNNGYGMTINLALLGDGQHSMQIFVDGAELASHAFNVHTLSNEAFLRGKSYQASLPDFPEPGQNTQLKWSEADQNFVILGVN